MILYKTDYYLYTTLAVKSPSFLEEKFFTRCELQGTSCKFLEKRRKDEIIAPWQKLDFKESFINEEIKRYAFE